MKSDDPRDSELHNSSDNSDSELNIDLELMKALEESSSIIYRSRELDPKNDDLLTSGNASLVKFNVIQDLTNLNNQLKEKLILFILENASSDDLIEEKQNLKNIFTENRSAQTDQSQLIRFYVKKFLTNLAKINKHQSYDFNDILTRRPITSEQSEFFILYLEESNTMQTTASSCFKQSSQELFFKPDDLMIDTLVTELTKPICDEDETILMVSRHIFKQYEITKNNIPVKLDDTKIEDSLGQSYDYHVTAGTTHIGKSWGEGHYKTFIKVVKEGKECWVCYNDSQAEIIDDSQLNSNGIPIELEKNCYFIKYSRASVELPKFEEIKTFANPNYQCWFISATTFMQSFSDFRNFLKDLNTQDKTKEQVHKILSEKGSEASEKLPKDKSEYPNPLPKISFDFEFSSTNNSLHQAIENNEPELVETLISSISKDRLESFINSKNNDGETALHLAVKYGNFELARILLKNGANISLRDKFGYSPLGLAIIKNNKSFIEAYIQILKSKEIVYVVEKPKEPLRIQLQQISDSDTKTLSQNSQSLIFINPETRIINAPEQYHHENLGGYPIKQSKFNLSSNEDLPIPFNYLSPTIKQQSSAELRAKVINDNEDIFLAIFHCEADNQDYYLELIELMITRGLYDINSINKKGRSPLMEAIAHKKNKIALLLIELGADVNICQRPSSSNQEESLTSFYLLHSNYYNSTPTKRQSLFLQEIPSILTDTEIERTKISTPKIKINNTETALMLAVLTDSEGDNMEVIRALINHPEINFNTPGSELQTLLHIAVKKQKYELVEALLFFKKCKINSQDQYGVTALHIASEMMDHKMIAILKKYGASSQYQNMNQETPCDVYFKSSKKPRISNPADDLLDSSGVITIRSRFQILDIMTIDTDSSALKDNDGNYFNKKCELFDAVRTNDYHNTQRLLEEPVSARIVDGNKVSLLQISILNNNLEIFQLLLNHNAPYISENKFGEHALASAVRLQRLEMVKLITEKQDFKSLFFFDDEQEEKVTSPFLTAFNNNDQEMFKLIMNFYLQNIQDTCESNNIYRAILSKLCRIILESDNKEMTEIFLNHRNENGQSIVHLTCKSNYPELVEMLIEKNVIDPACGDNNQKTPLDLARENNHSTIIEILSKKFSSPSSQSLSPKVSGYSCLSNSDRTPSP